MDEFEGQGPSHSILTEKHSEVDVMAMLLFIILIAAAITFAIKIN